ncbi:hypothetical protein FI667_g1562, partial [Globisporangium splendens]
MDAWFRGLMKSIAFDMSPAHAEPEILLSKRSSGAPTSAAASNKQHMIVELTSGSYQLQQQEHRLQQLQQQQQQQQQKPSSPSSSRIAHWDKKREKCNNCNLIYLKTLSRHAGFCSVDCKSNAAYLHKVNRTIRAMKSAVEQRQQQQQEVEETEQVVAATVQEPECEPQVEAQEPVEAESEPETAATNELHDARAHTFADFGLESRILDASNVEWAFSALY